MDALRNFKNRVEEANMPVEITCRLAELFPEWKQMSRSDGVNDLVDMINARDEKGFLDDDIFVRLLKGMPDLPEHVGSNHVLWMIEHNDIEGLEKFKVNGLMDTKKIKNLKMYFQHAQDTGAGRSFEWLVENTLNGDVLADLLENDMKFGVTRLFYILRKVRLSKEQRLNLIDTAWGYIADRVLPEIDRWIFLRGDKKLDFGGNNFPLVAAYIENFGQPEKTYRGPDSDAIADMEDDLRRFVLMLKMVEKSYPPVDDYISTFGKDAAILRLLMETYDESYAAGSD